MIGYRYLSAAEEELAKAALHYENAAAGLGEGFLDDVRKAVEALRTQPMSGAPLTGNFRKKILQQFPFSLIYSVEADGILIIAVAHQSRRPGYWRKRSI